MLTLRIRTETEAFEGKYLELEVARILRVAADRVEQGVTRIELDDADGRRIGMFALTTRKKLTPRKRGTRDD